MTLPPPPPPRACHHPGCDRHPVIGIGGPGSVTWWCRRHYPATSLEEAP